MRSKLSIFIVVVSVLALVEASGGAANRSMGRKGGFSPAAEHLEGNTLTLDMTAPYEHAELTLTGPGGVRIQKVFAGGEAISLQLVHKGEEPLANGSYRYSLRISPRPANDSAYKSGMFFVRDGAALSRQAWRAELEQTREALNFERAKQRRAEQRQAREQKRASAVKRGSAETRPGADPGADWDYYGTLGIWDDYPSIYFYANDGSGYYYAGRVYGGSQHGYSLFTYGYVWNNIYAGYGTWIEAPYNITTGYGNYDRAYGYLYNNYPYGGYTAMLAVGYNYGPSGYIGSYAQNLVVMPFGVGVGTHSPTADLEVADYDFAAVRLYSYLGATWAFSSTPYGAGEFTVNKIGSGGQEFTVRTRLNASGPTMEVQGSVKGTTFISSSSREVKTDFRALDGKEVLGQLSEVPVMSWRYKTEDEDERHFGPVAEDFQAAFQLGDGKTITNIDADGVALAAIQGLHSLLQERDAELNALRSEVADLRRLLESQHPEH